jgi:hypothetical protein
VKPDPDYEVRVMARGYVVTRGRPADEDDNTFTAPVLLLTTCWIEATQKGDAENAGIFPVFDPEVTIPPSCGGCTVYCGPLRPRKRKKSVTKV